MNMLFEKHAQLGLDECVSESAIEKRWRTTLQMQHPSLLDARWLFSLPNEEKIISEGES